MRYYIELPIASLLPYREFNRRENPSPKIAYLPQTNLNKLKKDIAINGIIEPITLTVCTNHANVYAIVNDGNNRLTIADELGIKTCKVEVIVTDIVDLNDDIYYGNFKKSTADAMKIVDDNFIRELGLIKWHAVWN